VAGNPRIDDLRRRLEKDPGSRLFAQLAEELRKDGDLEEAINVCREGLSRQPAYPSARMTLGRALFDTGDLAAARVEFETVLKGAPDNILASRLLAESLEGLGDLPGAAKQYRATLALAPGDRQVQARLDAVEKRLKAGPAAAAPAPPRPPAASVTPPTIIMAAPPPPPPTPASVATVRAPRPPELASDTSPDKLPAPEPEPLRPPPAPVQRDYAPIPLVAADETFELEAAHEAPPTRVGGGAGAAGADWVVGIALPTPPAKPAAPQAPETFPMPEETLIEPPKAPLAPGEEAFELERPYESPVTQWATPSPPAAPAPAAEVRPPHEPATDFAEEFAPPEPPPRPAGAPLDLPPLPAEPPAAAPPVIASPEPIPAPPPAAEPPSPAADLSSATLAELYFNQGFTDKALDVYRQLVEREPGNERARARMAEIEALDRHLRDEEARGPQPEPGAPADPAAVRRKAIERTIARLEAMLAAVKKEQP
jgi:Flp pilus assembly protein TadD